MLNLKRKKSFTISNRNSLSKLKHEDLYPWETTVRVEDSIINDITGERIREINLLKYAIYGPTVADMEHYLIPKILKKPSNIILRVGTNDVNHPKQS